MEQNDHVSTLTKILEDLRTGKSVKVIPYADKKILRISWLNIVHEPKVFQAFAKLIKADIVSKSYAFDAVASIETSGAKYGLALSYETAKPYFSIHKASKLVFETPVTAQGVSVTESKPVTLTLDRTVASKFRNVVLIDDVRRTSTTINTAAKLLRECGTEVSACYVILDLVFAGHPRPDQIPPENYRPLFVVSHVDEEGRCVVDDGLVPRFLSKRL